MTAIEIGLALLAGHALADYPLQGDFLARGKNHLNPIPGIPWYQCLIWHSAIHAAFVGFITGSVILGVTEFIIHAMTDYAKCDGLIGFDTDQLIHVTCKFIWVLLLLAVRV